MPITTLWAAKGGSGVTVVAAGLALSSRGATLIDLAGELPAVLGIDEPVGQGLHEWFASDARPAAVRDLAVAVSDGIDLVPRGAAPIDPAHARWTELVAWMCSTPHVFVIDAGTGLPPPALRGRAGEEPDASLRCLLVTRRCYLSLRRAVALSVPLAGAVVVDEPERALSDRDVARSVGAPVLACVPIDPAIARAVDAGTLAWRLPGSLQKALRPLHRSAA